ncbi:MAG TPA: DUF4197 domain-containing protein [Cytophagales bacterium]|nr:DUF4197 domain-containing protein [Cytophagales bacterium]
MKKQYLVWGLIALGTASCAELINLQQSTGIGTTTGKAPLTEGEIAQGLKEALKVGSRNASNTLSVTDGFNRNSLVRIPFPPEAKVVADKLRSIGMGSKVDEFELTLNRAAEKASNEAANIFVNAITSMTINDAVGILKGQDNAATEYLKRTTSPQLTTAFKPHIQTALNSTYATSKWTEITSIYNKIPMVKPVNTDLVSYTNEKALQGLFFVVAQEELKIRKDPAARVSDILRRVFGSTQ